MQQIILFLAFLCLPFIANTQTNTKAAAAQKLLDDAFEKNAFIGASAGYSIDGKIEWQGAVGYADEAQKTAHTPMTSNRTASITKPMTAIAIMQLVEQGKIDLDAPLQTYLPNFPKAEKGTMTVRHLLQHSSGINGYKNNKERNNCKEYSNLEAAVAFIQDRKLLFEPGSDFNYTSYGYAVLARVVEVASGLTFEDYLRTNIWEKAGMTNTGIEDYGVTYPNKATIYHRTQKGKIRTEKELIKANKALNLSDRIGGGGVFSNVPDLLKFGDAILNNTLVSAATMAEMITDTGLKTEGNGYGMGWYLYGENEQLGSNVYGHNGGQIGCSAFLFLLPERGIVAVVMSNTSGALQEVSTIAVHLFHLAGVSPWSK